jgi:hypothetical protein
LEAANDIVSAHENGVDPSEAIERYQATRITPNRVSELLRKCKPPKGAGTFASLPSSTGIVVTSGVIPIHKPNSVSLPEFELKFAPGDWFPLADYFCVEHEEKIRDAFNLPPAQKAEAFEQFIKEIAQRALHLDSDGGDLRIHVEYVAREPGRAA